MPVEHCKTERNYQNVEKELLPIIWDANILENICMEEYLLLFLIIFP